MAIRSLIFLLLLSSVSAWAGNGSSGVGTASVLPGFTVKSMEDKIENIQDRIVDKENNEEIIKVINVSKDEVNLKTLSKSRLGSVEGYEYIPSDSKKENYWIICKSSKEECYKLIPLSKKNKKIPSILGSLLENKE